MPTTSSLAWESSSDAVQLFCKMSQQRRRYAAIQVNARLRGPVAAELSLCCRGWLTGKFMSHSRINKHLSQISNMLLRGCCNHSQRRSRCAQPARHYKSTLCAKSSDSYGMETLPSFVIVPDLSMMNRGPPGKTQNANKRMGPVR